MNKSAYILQLEAKDLLNTMEIKNKKRNTKTLEYYIKSI